MAIDKFPLVVAVQLRSLLVLFGALKQRRLLPTSVTAATDLVSPGKKLCIFSCGLMLIFCPEKTKQEGCYCALNYKVLAF
jgi:hypothetical protein